MTATAVIAVFFVVTVILLVLVFLVIHAQLTASPREASERIRSIRAKIEGNLRPGMPVDQVRKIIIENGPILTHTAELGNIGGAGERPDGAYWDSFQFGVDVSGARYPFTKYWLHIHVVYDDRWNAIKFYFFEGTTGGI